MASHQNTASCLADDQIKKELFLRELLRQRQWDKAIQLINSGVSTESRDAALGLAARCGQWERITQILQQDGPDVCWDSLLYEALLHRQWGCVTNIVQKGVREDCFNAVLHEAVKVGRWDVVIFVVQRGVSVECRDVLLHEALRQQQWECVTQIMQQGVSLHCRNSAFMEAVQHNRWQCVAVLVKHGVSPDLIHLAVGHLIQQHHLETSLDTDRFRNIPSLSDQGIRLLIHQCKWNCITQFVRLGLLTAEQRDYLCQEAVPWGHHECAVELLRQGVSPTNARWIVWEVFRWGNWQLVTDLMKQGQRLSSDERTIVFSTAAEFREWEAFLQILRYESVSDSQLIQAMTIAVEELYHDIIPRLTRSTRNGLRVFQQLCLKQQWMISPVLYVSLRDEEKDLAFYVAVTQGLTDYTGDLYDDTSVSKKSRRFALRHAIRQGDWDLVILMASKPVTEESQRRLAFLAAIRQGKWRMALKLLDNGLTLSNKDAKFSVKMCRCLNELDGIVQLCLRLHSDEVGMTAIKTALHRTVDTDDLDSFDTLFDQCLDEPFANEEMFEAVIHRIVKKEKSDFLVRLMENLYETDFCEELVNVAFETICKLRKWNFLQRILESGVFLLASQYVLILDKIKSTRNAWRVCVPALEERCVNFYLDDWESMYYAKYIPDTRALAKWCRRESFHNMFVLLAVKSKNWPLVTRILPECAGEVCRGLLITGMNSALDDQKINVAVICMRHLDPKDDSVTLDLHNNNDVYRDLREKCRQAGLPGWMIGAAIRNDKWDDVEADLEQCTDQSLIDFATTKAAYRSQWNTVIKCLHRCSQDNKFLSCILRLSMDEGNLPCTEHLVETVDIPNLNFSKTIMYNAVNSRDNRIELVRICIKAGISAHRSLGGYHSPMRRALYNGQLPIVRLLYESGCSSNTELHSLKKDQTLRAQLQRQHREDIVQYADHVASNPSSLQQLCRLTVSHLVGCRPGRRDRMFSLPVPDIVRDFIMFSDLTG